MKIKSILFITILLSTTSAFATQNPTCIKEGGLAPLWVCDKIVRNGYLSAVGHAKSNPIETMKYVMGKAKAKTNLRIKQAKHNNKYINKIALNGTRFTGEWVAPSGDLYVHITARVLVK